MAGEERIQAAIREGEMAWEKASTSNWEESSWRVMGTALTLMREEVLHELHTNNPRGRGYNEAFARRLNGTKFKTMDPSTRSHLLFCMEPQNRIVLDALLERMQPSERARRTHPTTLAKMIRTELRPDKEESAASGKLSPTERIKQLETENAELKRRQSEGSLFDLNRDSVESIAEVLVGNGKSRAEKIARAVLKKTKTPAG